MSGWAPTFPPQPKPERGTEMANEDKALEDLATVGSQLLGELADKAPAVVEHVLSGMSPEQQEQGRAAISTGRWNNNRRG
jgi:hypothetical protein